MTRTRMNARVRQEIYFYPLYSREGDKIPASLRRYRTIGMHPFLSTCKSAIYLPWR